MRDGIGIQCIDKLTQHIYSSNTIAQSMYRILSTLPWDEISTWPALELAIATLDSEQTRGEAFEEFCHGFFTLHSQLYQITNVWRFRNIPPALLVRLGTNTKQDKGIDGVLLHEDETITAYQAKFRIDRSLTPSQREVSTFYMVSDRADYRLIISNVDDLPVVIKERKDHGQILVDKLLELDRTFFSQLADLARGTNAPARSTLTPRPYQREALTSIVTGLTKGGRGQAILACGAGKSLLGKWVCDSLECDSALVMVPSLALIRQTLGEWHRANTKPFRYLCVCGDSTVDAQSDDSWVVNPSDLDCRVTTSPADVVSFLNSDSRTARVIFCTYQSGDVIVSALKSEALSSFTFDFALCDEAHRLVGLSTKTFGHILNNESIRARRRLFMTATPKIVQPLLNEDTGQDRAEVFSMDDESVFGSVLYRFGFERAIQEKVICDYQIVVIGVSEDEANKLSRDQEVLRTTDSGRWSIEGLAQRIALAKAISTYGIQKIFSFHSRVAAASRFVDVQMPDSFSSVMKQIALKTTFLASHISGAMSSGVRAKVLREFEAADRAVIANARCLGEGVNVPVVDAVFFSDPKDSVIEIVQATGRALRRKENKETAYVMIPVLIRAGEDAEAVLRSSRFDSVWKVVSAMSSQDDRLQSTMAQAAMSKGANVQATGAQYGASGVRGLPDYRTIVMGFPPDLPLSEYQRLFSLEAVEKTGDLWFVRFGALKRYVELHGAEPTVKTKFEGINLGVWLKTQKAAFAKKQLASEKFKLITALGVSLSRSNQDLWFGRFGALKRYVELHGEEPKLKTKFAGINLGVWLAMQRKEFAKKQLASEKCELITALGVSLSRSDQDRWERQLMACKVFLDVNHRLPSPKDGRFNGMKIGEWLAHQRTFYRKNELTKEMVERLEQLLGPVLDPRRDRWNRNFEAYKDYVKTTGKQPLRRTIHNGLRIGAWRLNLRQQLRALSLGQINDLNAAGWSPPIDAESICKQERDRVLQDLTHKQEHDKQEQIDSELRIRFADQTDEEWLLYYVWCKEEANSSSTVLAKGSDERKQDVYEWFQFQWGLFRDKKLPEHRRRHIHHLLNLRAR